MYKRIICLILVTAIILTGCSGSIKNQTIAGTTCANIIMGNGEFAYYDGMIYFTDYFNIFEYDIKTKQLLGFDSTHSRITDIASSQDNIYFNSSGLLYISKDGKAVKTEFQYNKTCVNLYIEDNKAYFINGIGGDFVCRDLKNGTETLIHREITNYYIDETNIWLINKNDLSTKLKCYNRKTTEITDVDLSFNPVAIMTQGDKIYLSKPESYDIVMVSNGVETELPIKAYFYQIIGNELIFLDETTFENSCCSLKKYNLSTGETETIYENIFSFCVLNNKYICVHIGTHDEKYAFYDMDTKEKTLMYIKTSQ